MTDAAAVAARLRGAYANRQTVPPPSSLDPAFDLAAGYAVERELARLRRESGRAIVGRKVGFASKAVWRALKLDTLVWASMYDDTVRETGGAAATLSIGRMIAPKIEPEIVFKLKQPLAGTGDPAAVLAAVEWLALGFEIIDCAYPDWKFQPADFVAAYGLHAALFVGEPTRVTPVLAPSLVEQLPAFTVTLSRDGEIVQEGSGRSVLRSPALCLGELASAIARRPDVQPLAAGEIISSGTLTESQPILAGETWAARVEGIPLHSVTLHIT